LKGNIENGRDVGILIINYEITIGEVKDVIVMFGWFAVWGRGITICIVVDMKWIAHTFFFSKVGLDFNRIE
jgi:hypothetical protein